MTYTNFSITDKLNVLSGELCSDYDKRKTELEEKKEKLEMLKKEFSDLETDVAELTKYVNFAKDRWLIFMDFYEEYLKYDNE